MFTRGFLGGKFLSNWMVGIFPREYFQAQQNWGEVELMPRFSHGTSCVYSKSTPVQVERAYDTLFGCRYKSVSIASRKTR